MKHCALLTMDDLSDFECYDHLINPPLNKLGWQVEDVSWKNKQVNWNNYDAVIVRSPWDYQEHLDEFILLLKNIEGSTALLVNSLELQLWNINKKYLKTLEDKGCKIVPTLWQNSYSEDSLVQAFDYFSCDELIIKPCVSAGASDTFRLSNKQPIEHNKLTQIFNHRDFMMQPFIKQILDPGEYSIFYFNGQYSHAILKTPKENDFRVQEEYGGQLAIIDPSQALLQHSQEVLQQLPDQSLYARLDFVKVEDDYLLMEAELIEPSLYFNMDDQSASRFAKAFNHYYEEN
ncbi:MAG: hypothetical protein Q9M92_01655 [Enterobacterales bacterium]|nr:hypothetical protein [Enterobacterales bacterium]